MDEKVGKRVEGVQKFPRCLRGLLLLLAVLMIFNSVLTVSAAEFSITSPLDVTYTADNGETWQGSGSNNTIIISDTVILGRTVSASVKFNQTFSNLSPGDTFNVTADINDSIGGINGGDLVLSVIGASSSAFGNTANGRSVTATGTVDKDGTLNVTVILRINNLKYSYPDRNSRTKIKVNFTATNETETNGLLNKIIEFIKEIPTKIGEFFTSLSNSLRSWFESVGQWFTDLGDKISGFFDNLFNNIKDFFTNLFIPDENYFTDLSDDLDKTLSDSLGFIYTIPKTLLEEVNTMYDSLNSSSYGNLTINMPAIEFNLLGNHYTLYEGGQTDLYQAGNMPWLDTVLDVARAMITIVIVVGCARMIYKKVVNKVGIEGGDEL